MDYKNQKGMFQCNYLFKTFQRQDIGKSQAKHRPSKKRNLNQYFTTKPSEYKHLIISEVFLLFSLIISMPNNPEHAIPLKE